jgi:hypothetical protein
LIKEPKTYAGENTASSTNDAEETGYVHANTDEPREHYLN